jgi:fructose-1,6-bisphosphatase I
MAFIAEQAGGIATNGTDRILELQPKDIHQRTPLALGSRVEMEEFQQVCGANLATAGG